MDRTRRRLDLHAAPDGPARRAWPATRRASRLGLAGALAFVLVAGCDANGGREDEAPAATVATEAPDAGGAPDAGRAAEVDPRAATAFGEDVAAADAREMQGAVLDRLFSAYASEHGIEATDAEIDGFLARLDAARSDDVVGRERRIAEIDSLLATDDLSDLRRRTLEEQRTRQRAFLDALEDEAKPTGDAARQRDAMRRGLARAVIERWKVNRALHEEFGGRVIYQQLGPEPLDAYRAFLERSRDAGDFTIHHSSWEPEFWRYFTDDALHDFVEPGSAEEAEAFATPPWERDLESE